MSNPYLYNKLVQVHENELLHEAEQQRMLAQLPQHHSHLMRNGARRLAAFLMNIPFSTRLVVPPARKATGQL